MYFMFVLSYLCHQKKILIRSIITLQKKFPFPSTFSLISTFSLQVSIGLVVFLFWPVDPNFMSPKVRLSRHCQFTIWTSNVMIMISIKCQNSLACSNSHWSDFLHQMGQPKIFNLEPSTP